MFALFNFIAPPLRSRRYTYMITLALQAMATRFELVLNGDSPGLRAAGEEALAEISRIEAMLSLYKPTSEVANLNGRAGGEAVRVSAEMFALLQRAVALSRETNGAFDITIAPLVRCWGFMQGQGSVPSDEQIEEARANVGFQLLELNEAERSVRFLRPGLMLDFGAFGKGYAVDRAIEVLRETGVASALLHGGTSTVFGMGRAENNLPWKIAVTGEPPGEEVLWLVDLREESLSVSAVWGKSFASQGRTFGHILDARTGRPSERAELAAVNVASAADSDALSTALLVDGPNGLNGLAKQRPEARALVFATGKIFTHNIDEAIVRPR
jgi:thiamine biosynthesis lipoprotein